jgi:hypothetical protein
MDIPIRVIPKTASINIKLMLTLGFCITLIVAVVATVMIEKEHDI